MNMTFLPLYDVASEIDTNFCCRSLGVHDDNDLSVSGGKCFTVCLRQGGERRYREDSQGRKWKGTGSICCMPAGQP